MLASTCLSAHRGSGTCKLWGSEEHDSDDQTASKGQPGSSQDDNRRSDRSSEAVPTINVSPTGHADSDVTVLLQELKENISAAKDRGAQQIRIDVDSAASIIQHLEARSNDYKQLKSKLDGMNVSSTLYFSLQLKLMSTSAGK